MKANTMKAFFFIFLVTLPLVCFAKDFSAKCKVLSDMSFILSVDSPSNEVIFPTKYTLTKVNLFIIPTSDTGHYIKLQGDMFGESNVFVFRQGGEIMMWLHLYDKQTLYTLEYEGNGIGLIMTIDTGEKREENL